MSRYALSVAENGEAELFPLLWLVRAETYRAPYRASPSRRLIVELVVCDEVLNRLTAKLGDNETRYTLTVSKTRGWPAENVYRNGFLSFFLQQIEGSMNKLTMEWCYETAAEDFDIQVEDGPLFGSDPGVVNWATDGF